jgi:CRP-like cAMP-binding protein
VRRARRRWTRRTDGDRVVIDAPLAQTDIGSPPAHGPLIVIVDGTATVHVGDRTIAVLGPGDFFGEIALLDDGPRTATVIADTDLLVGLARRLRAADLQLSA